MEQGMAIFPAYENQNDLDYLVAATRSLGGDLEIFTDEDDVASTRSLRGGTAIGS
jgi:hypothetical protein